MVGRGLNEEIRARIERTKERDAQVNKELEAIGWTVHRFWEEELKDWRAVAERFSKEIWRRLDWLKAEIAGAHEVDRQSEEEIRRLKEGEQDILL